jgi:uncharacterized membrane protein HdeD (DUF308 family)
MVAVAGAVLVLLRGRLAGLVHSDLLVELVGVSAVLTGVLRVLGGFAAEKRLGRRWTIGGVVLGTLETALGGLLLLSSEIDPDVLWPVAAARGWRAGACSWSRGCACAAWPAPSGGDRAAYAAGPQPR